LCRFCSLSFSALTPQQRAWKIENIMNKDFPSIITQLPEAGVPIPGVKAFLAQAGDQQFVFMTFDQDVEVPEHAHAAQWGVILDGQIELTIDGEKHLFKKGDSYFIPENARHSASIKKGYRDLTLFDQKDRFQRKVGTAATPRAIK
jgi:quercetin dioxygenase-like cupin family protein